MSPGLLYIRCLKLIIPIRITLSFALFFISIKANVVYSSDGSDWSIQPPLYLLLATACVNLLMACVSATCFMIRDDELLPPRLRWASALCGLVTRVLLFALVVTTVVVIAHDSDEVQFRNQELCSVCLIVGMARKLQAMRAANAAGEEEVRKEITKRLEAASRSNSAMSTPKMAPASLRAVSTDDLPPLYLKYYNNSEQLAPYTYIN
ncbi:14151_t:CDS:2 [Acaulospora colombiana]|uniref:14151_t:CDS:1 n=1 Tax=Acaulospora colombiana TaxID=27376 RepID=A0ACA9MCA2_9GLOM|nr:14151_t:CDS:2 [Acaulospora colombiana]